MGSSMVMMCSSRVSLISSIMAASVVDLPEPVGPVTRTKPRGFLVELVQRLGQAELIDAHDVHGDESERRPQTVALEERVHAEARAFGTEYEKSISHSVSRRCR